MNVLFVSNDPSIFDPASAARSRMRAYSNAIGQLHIVSPAAAGAQKQQEGPLYLYPVRAPRLLRMFALAQHARRIIEMHAIDVVSAQDPFEQGIAALRAVEGTRAKLHIQIHTDFLSPWFVRSGNARSARVRMPLLNRYRLRMADRVLPRAAGIRVVSERIAHELAQKYGSRIAPPSVIPIETPGSVPDAVPLAPHEFSFALIAVGRLEPEKRLEDSILALRQVHEKYPMVGLVCVGEGSERTRLERLVAALGLGNHVLFLGSRPDAWGLMRSAQGFIQASAYEGYGRTLIEAALAKIPIITTDVGIVGEVFKGYEDVLASPVGDPASLASHIRGLVEDTAARVEMVMHAERAAREHLAAARNAPADIAQDLAKTLV